jgi:hypothetical protein
MQHWTGALEHLPVYLCWPHGYVVGSISWNPLLFFREIATSISNLRQIHGMIDLFGPPLIGGIALLGRAPPFGLFCVLWVLAVSCLSNPAMYRLIIPGQAFALLLGFDSVIGCPSHRTVVCVFAVLLVVLDTAYAMGESTKLNIQPKIWYSLAYPGA